MKVFNLLLISLLLSCNSKKVDTPVEALATHPTVEKIHLYRINGMVDMSKPVSTLYFCITPDETFTISEVRRPDGSLLEADTIKTENKNNSELLAEAEALVEEKENPGLDNDGNRWGVTIFYNAGQKNFSYSTDENFQPIVGKLYNQLTRLEKQ